MRALLRLSSNFCILIGPPARRPTILSAGWLLWVVLARAPTFADTPVRFGDVVRIAANDFAFFDGYSVDCLGLVACVHAACHAIPFQIDERDATGAWALDQGPEANFDDPPGVLDGNDFLFFMAADAGDQVQPADLPRYAAGAEITIHDPLTGSTRWTYLFAVSDAASCGAAPHSGTAFVQYDPTTDRVRAGEVSLGFSRGVPAYLAIADGRAGSEVNLLDRFKVRATATFLWGLIRFSWSEDDLSTQFSAWRQGPIRVIRRQRQWMRIGWGIRAPIFGSYTYFYRDFAELPVGLYLNFPPRYFFGNIAVSAILDFRDLKGWSLLTPSLAAPIPIDGVMTTQKAALNRSADSWFALLGPRITLVQTMSVGPSLASVRRRLLYREDGDKPEPPEAVPGEEPGIGYQLDQWNRVGAGAHQLMSVSYALPVGVDVRAFMAAREAPLRVTVRALQ